MGVSRNDPCPCGSGRKFKSCCLHKETRNEAQGTLPFDTGRGVLLPREVREEALHEPVWKAEALPVMMTIAENGSERPVLMLVMAGELVVHLDMRGRLGGEASKVAEALERAVATTAQSLGAWPETVQVRHAEVANALRPLLATREVSVTAVDPIPEIEEAARSLMNNVLGAAHWPPVCRTEAWSAWDLPRTLFAELFSGAADFWRAMPWRYASNLQAPRVRMPSGREWTTCILGNAGQEFGLALYSDADDLFVRALDSRPEQPFGDMRGRIISITFERVVDMPDSAIRESRIGRWEIAAPAAFPTLMTVNTPGGGAPEEDVRDLVTLIRGLPAFVDQHRLALMREERTGEPCTPIDWLHGDTGVRFRYAGEAVLSDAEIAGSASDDFVADMHPEFLAAMQQAVAEAGEDADPDAVLAAANRRLAQITRNYNQSAQPELGDLSPDQVRRLMDPTDWVDGDAAVRLRQDLTLADLADSLMLRNARTLLAYAAENNGLAATQAGNLKLAVVETLLDRLDFEGELVEFLRRVSKRITEQDVGPLHELRVIAEVGGLLQPGGARFKLTRDGIELLEETHAGRLYARLFDTCFRSFNLEYGSMFDWPQLQPQVAFTLYRLGKVAGRWRSADELLETAVLPYAQEHAPESVIIDFPSMLLERYVLERLVGFALLERRQSSKTSKPAVSRYRITPLFGKFLQFDIGEP